MFCKVIIFILFTLFANVTFAKDIKFKCIVTDELENRQKAKKLYSEKPLFFFLNKKKKWLYDLLEKNLKDKEGYFSYHSRTLFNENDQFYFFRIFKFQTKKMRIKESYDFIILDKIDGFFRFVKNYFDNNEKVFFSSELRGYCEKISE
tara:strand:+ start:844 stop:1287 length:444 start_codon:yes stop_codon:yes gene_type:complete